MKRKMVQHRTASGLMYATFEKPQRKGFDWQGFIDKSMTVVLTAWLFILAGYAGMMLGVMR